MNTTNMSHLNPGCIFEAEFNFCNKKIVGMIKEIHHHLSGTRGQYTIIPNISYDSNPKRLDLITENGFDAGYITKILSREKIKSHKEFPSHYFPLTFYILRKERWAGNLAAMIKSVIRSEFGRQKIEDINFYKAYTLYRKAGYPGILDEEPFNPGFFIVKSKPFKKWVLKNRFKLTIGIKKWRENQKKFNKEWDDEWENSADNFLGF